jgi:hypothetical protein
MPSDPSFKRWCSRLTVPGIGPLLFAILAICALRLAHLGSGVSTFEFVNQSAEVLSRVEMHFLRIIPGTDGNVTNYQSGFSRSFTNLLPGHSILVRSSTPVLVLCDLNASHRYLGPTGEWAGTWGGIGTGSSYESPVVVATPGQRAGLRFTGFDTFSRIDTP